MEYGGLPSEDEGNPVSLIELHVSFHVMSNLLSANCSVEAELPMKCVDGIFSTSEGSQFISCGIPLSECLLMWIKNEPSVEK